jgi:hypothetical protein
MTETITAEQGSQPHFGDVLVGIMRIGAKDGRAVAQLAVRSPRAQDITIVDVGDTLDLGSAGSLHIDAITPIEGTVDGTVTFSFSPLG